ncbi:MAG TPA: hypothetical protein VIP28_15180 [Nocardioides sp.]
MSGYVVSGALATVKDAAGALHYRYQGAPLPEGIDEEQLERLVSLGLIEKVKAPKAAPAPKAPPAPTAPAKPAANASKEAWVDYAVAQGVDKAEADKLPRDQLAEKFAS